MNVRICKQCGSDLKKRSQRKYCSNQCQADSRYEDFKVKWLHNGRVPEMKIISRHIKRYLIEVYGNRCSLCGWCKKHPITRNVPVEVDHIDGNSQNNKKGNLRLLCPNCHSLTPSYRALNTGNGRVWRKKYV